MGNHKPPIQLRPTQPGQQIQVQIDMRNATQKACECGSKNFVPAVTLFDVSALVSPTGQRLTIHKSVFVCMDCKKEIAIEL